jgi:hypothetical protein
VKSASIPPNFPVHVRTALGGAEFTSRVQPSSTVFPPAQTAPRGHNLHGDAPNAPAPKRLSSL